MANMMQALREVLVEAHEAQADRVIWSDISGKVRRTENTVRRFEKGESAPKFDEIDLFVNGYAEALDLDPMALWQQALERAQLVSSEFDPDAAVERAVATARRAAKSAEAQSRSDAEPSRSSKSSPRKRARK